jgi:hypothetical protein
MSSVESQFVTAYDSGSGDREFKSAQSEVLSNISCPGLEAL